MKKQNFIGIAVFIIALFVSCEDSDNGLDVQNHANNNYAMIMDTMLADMMDMEMTGDADYDFARMMMMHHDGAINLSRELLDQNGADSIEIIAQQIIDKQQAEKIDLMEFLETHTPVPTEKGADFDRESMINAKKLDKAKDIEILLGDDSYDYSKMIILHHQGAIDMAQSVIHHGSNEMIIEMAKTTVEDQNEEILKIQNWLLNNRPY